MTQVRIGTCDEKPVIVSAHSVADVDWAVTGASEYVHVTFNDKSKEHDEYNGSVFLDRNFPKGEGLDGQVKVVKTIIAKALKPN